MELVTIWFILLRKAVLWTAELNIELNIVAFNSNMSKYVKCNLTNFQFALHQQLYFLRGVKFLTNRFILCYYY